MPRRQITESRGRPSLACSRSTRKISPPDSDPPVPADLVVKHPRIRGECRGGPRPCPLVGCLYNNYLEIRIIDGVPRIKILHPERQPEDMPPADSCTLDVADSGPQTLDRVAGIFGLTRERIRQIEVRLLARIHKETPGTDEDKD